MITVLWCVFIEKRKKAWNLLNKIDGCTCIYTRIVVHNICYLYLEFLIYILSIEAVFQELALKQFYKS